MSKSSIKKNVYLLLIALVLLIGGTYAWFTLTINNSKTNIIRAGKLKINLIDCEKDLVLKNAVPVSDNKGMQSEVCTFKVENTGTTSIDYSVYLDDTDELTTDERMNDKYVKFGLIKNDGDPKIGELPTTGVNPDRVLTSEKISGSTTDTYKLRLWINQDADNGVMGTIFSGKVRVDATQSKPPAANLKAIDKTQNISSVVFQVVNDTPTNTSNTNNKAKVKKLDNKKDAEVVKVASMKSQAAASYDVSVEQDKSVMQYNVLNEDGTTYTAYIEASKKIVAPEDSTSLLAISTATSITGLENLDTSKVTNMYGFFNGVKATSLDISSLDTSNVTNMGLMFGATNNLQTIDLSKLDSSNVTNMSLMFCQSGITQIDLSPLNTSKVTNMFNMFGDTNNISSVDLSVLDLSKVTNMSHMFQNSSVGSVEFSGLDNTSVEDISFMFAGTTNLDSVDLSGLNVSKVNKADNFINRSNVKELDLTGLSWNNLAEMDSMFYSSYKLEVLNANNMTLSKVTRLGGYNDGFGQLENMKYFNMNHLNAPNLTTIGNIVSKHSGFENSYSQTEMVDLSYMNAPNLKSFHSTFQYTNVKNVNLSNISADSLNSMFSIFSYTPYLENVNLTNTDTSNVTEFNYFFDHSAISSFDFAQLDTSSATNMICFLYGATNLITADLSSFDVSNVVDIGSIFSTSSIENLDIHGFNINSNLYSSDLPSNLKNLNMSDTTIKYSSSQWAFASWSNLETIDLSNTTINGLTEFTFYGLQKLTSVNMNNFNAPDCTSINNAFVGTTSLSDLDLSGIKLGNLSSMQTVFASSKATGTLDLSSLDASKLENIGNAFSGSNFTSINISGWNNSNLTSLMGMFNGASQLESIDMSDSNYSGLKSLSGVFSSLSALKTVNLSNSNLSGVSDASSMFSSSSSLTSVNLENVDLSSASTLSSSFYGCSSLTDINITGLKTGSLRDMSGMLSGTTSLTNFDFKSLDLSTVTNIIGVVNGSSITNINLDGVNMSALTTLNRAFYGATKLKNVNMKNATIPSVTDVRGMFEDDSALTTIDMSGVQLDKLEHADYWFKGCSNLSSIDISGATLSTDLVASEDQSNGYLFKDVPSGINVKVKDEASKKFIEDQFGFCKITGTATIV